MFGDDGDAIFGGFVGIGFSGWELWLGGLIGDEVIGEGRTKE